MVKLKSHKIEDMYTLQDKLNSDTNGSDWAQSGVTKEGRKINWLRCIYMETAEAIDSLNWKHWKDIHALDDIANLKVELVDIWHFIISEHIAQKGLLVAMKEATEKINSEIEISDDVTGDLIVLLEKLMKKAINGELPFIEYLHVIQKVDAFTMEDVYRLYIGKNCLNTFRQDHGYKDGSYVKMWQGKEDNVYMQNVLSENPQIDFKGLYNELKEIYMEVNSSLA